MIHYLDNAATTAVRPEVVEAMLPYFGEFYGNPSTIYSLGASSKQAEEQARKVIGDSLGAPAQDIYFTAGGSESDNWALKAAAEAYADKGKHIITSKIEHHAVLHTCQYLERQGYEVTYLKPDKTGHIAVDGLRAALRPDTALVSMMLVNNELGTVFPIAQCVQAVKDYDRGILFHCDAVQGFLKLPTVLTGLGTDLVTVSGHKLGAPKGVGALYVKKGVRLRPLLTGGGQEEGLRSGTEATAQIAGFAEACRQIMADRTRLERTQAIKDYALDRLKAEIPKLEVISTGDAPHICAVTLPGYKSEVVVRVLGDQGVCISSGSACHKGKPSHVFAALGLPKPWLDGALRISFSPDSTRDEADRLVSALKGAADRLFTTLS